MTIPNSVTSIGAWSLYGTAWYDNQPEGMVYAGLVAYDYKGTMPEGTCITIKDGTLGIAGGAFSDCSGLTSVIIPNSVTNIGDYSFNFCPALTGVTIPNSVTTIGEWAFYVCPAMKSVTIGNSVTSISKYSFYRCTNLESLIVASGNTTYDSRNNCNAIIETANNTLIKGCKNTVIPNTVTTIGEYAFIECIGLTSVTIPNSVITIGERSFAECSGLKNVTIGNSVTSINYSSFSECPNLENLSVVSGNTTFDSRNNCSAIIETASNTLFLGSKNTVIPNSVTSIGDYAFSECGGLTNISIPNSVTSIGSGAFTNCSSLTSVTIPNSVTSIGPGAFSWCSGLMDVYSYITNLSNVTVEWDTFGDEFSDYSARTLHVPAGTLASYQTDGHWYPYFGSIVEMEPEVTIPGDVDGNGVVGISDVTRIIDLILAGNATIEDNPAVDVNGDGLINIGDVTAIIDLILTLDP